MGQNSSRNSARTRDRGLKLKRGDKKALAELMRKGRESVRVIKRARALQLLAGGETYKGTARAVGVATSVVGEIKVRYRRWGLERALRDAARGRRERVFNGRQEQQLVAMLCGPSPTGRARWTVRLAATEAKNRKIVPKVGRETVRVLMSNHELKPWREKNVVRSGADAGVRGKNGGPSRTV